MSGTRLRIVYIHYRDSAASGGSLRVLEAIANHLDARRFEPHIVFAYGGPGPVARSSRVPCHFLRARGPANPLRWLRARAFVSGLEPDLIHYMDAVFWVRTALAGMRAPSLVHVHGPIVENRIARRDRVLWRVLARVSSGHVCITQALRETVLRLGWADPRRTWVVYNGIDTARFAQLPDRAAARSRLRVPRDAFVLTMLCRIVPEKGCREALEVMKLLPPAYHLLLCGEGPLRPALERATVQAGLSERVTFAGEVEDTREAYAASDALLFLSRQEPFGLVIGEAMAAGVPVVGLADDGGYREGPIPLVTPLNSLLVPRPAHRADLFAPDPPETLAAVAAHIQRVTSSLELLADRTQNARAWVSAHFDVGRQVRALEDLYLSLVPSGGTAR